MQRINIKLTETEYRQLNKAANMCGLSIEAYLYRATCERLRELQHEPQAPGLMPFPTMQLPAYPAPLEGFSPLANVRAGMGATDAARMRKMVVMKRSIDAELIRFAEAIIMGQS